MNREDNPKEWVRHAETDRRAARLLLRDGEYEPCAFHCQQAVEKLLKAVIVKQTNQRPVHTHDLSALLEKVKGVEIDEGIAKAVSDIDGYYAGALSAGCG